MHVHVRVHAAKQPLLLFEARTRDHDSSNTDARVYCLEIKAPIIVLPFTMLGDKRRPRRPTVRLYDAFQSCRIQDDRPNIVQRLEKQSLS